MQGSYWNPPHPNTLRHWNLFEWHRNANLEIYIKFTLNYCYRIKRYVKAAFTPRYLTISSCSNAKYFNNCPVLYEMHHIFTQNCTLMFQRSAATVYYSIYMWQSCLTEVSTSLSADTPWRWLKPTAQTRRSYFIFSTCAVCWFKTCFKFVNSKGNMQY